MATLHTALLSLTLSAHIVVLDYEGSGPFPITRGPTDHINKMILRSGCKAQFKRDSTNHGL